MTQLRKRLLPIVIFVTCLILIWTTAYWLLGLSNGANWSFFDCFYMTIQHVAPRAVVDILPNMGMPGRFLTLALIFIGLGAMVYLVSTITSFIIEGRFSEMYRRRAMLKQIAKLRNHFIICGANKTTQHVISELLKRELNFVVIEPDHDLLQAALSLGSFFYLECDPAVDEQLIAAGIKVARAMVIAMPSDETNLYITFASRELNPSVRIISRAIDATAGPRLLRAGANSVVNPDYIGGLRMVSESIRPSVVSFLDIMMRDSKSSFRIEEATVQKGSELENVTLTEACIKERTGALVLAVRMPDHKEFIYNPPNDIRLEPGTAIVVLADLQQHSNLKKLSKEAETLVCPSTE